MNIQAVKNSYKRYANFYDAIFGKILHPGRQLSVKFINQLTRHEANILEVGVGTGLSFPLYRPDLKIVGIDISKEMLLKAKLQATSYRCSNGLFEMDAEALAFANHSFDCVVAMYVASVVPNINNLLQEITRVCNNDGDIIIVNHFTSENRIMRNIEKKISSLHNFLGFQADFPMNKILEFPNLKLVASHKTNLFGYWTLLHFKKA